jgi:galactonate dehydratase
MKITAIETLVCHARMRNWVFVKVVTDQPGLIGWGEATLEWHTRSIVGAIEDMSHLLIGEDPTRVEYLWQMMYRQHFWHGHGIVRATAIAGIDLALWDIVGKVANMPLSKVFGGPVRDWVRTYCHLGGGKMEDFYQTPADNAKRFAELAQQAVADGYTAFKSMAVPSTMPIEGMKPVRAAAAAVAAMREAVGPDIDIMVDCHARPSPAMGLKFGKALDDFGLYFFEEPCWPEAVDGLAKINAALTTPVASGERVTNLEAFKDMFEKRAVEICQLDITHCGGLSAAKRIAALAEAHRIALAPHNPQGPRQHRRVAGVRFQPAELHHLRNRAQRRAVASGRGRGRLHHRNQRPHRPPEHQTRPRHHHQRSGGEEASFPAGDRAARVQPRWCGDGLVE